MFTGERHGEALGLTWDRVDRARGVIRLELTKSGHRREVPLSSNADGVFARRWTPDAKGYVFGSRNWNAFRSAWEAALEVTGIPKSKPTEISAQESTHGHVALSGVSAN